MAEGRDINVRINTGTIVRFVLIALLLVALYYMTDILLVVVTAVVIASSIEPVIRRLKKFKIHRIISAIAIYIVLGILLALGLIFFVPIVVSDAAQLINSLPTSVTFDELWGPVSGLGIHFPTGIGTALGAHSISVTDFVSTLQAIIVGTSAGAFKTASVLFGGVLSFILIIVLSFYLAVQEEGVADFLRIVAPVKHQAYIINLWQRSQRKIALWLQGQVVLAIVVGVLTYFVLVIIGIPNALLLAVLAGLLEIIPFFGPIVAAVPAIALAFLDKGIGTATIVLIAYVVIQQLESQLIYPLVVKKVVGVSPIVVILSLVIGAKFAGLLGALIAVPIAAALMEYVNDIEKYKKAEVAERAMVGKS